VLEIEDLKVSYGKAEAVKGISIRVVEGEVVGILGPNGAGKTSLLRAISGLQSKIEGSVKFYGEELAGLAPHLIARRGLVQAPEGRRLFPRLSVEENLRAGAHTRKRVSASSFDDVYALFPRLAERRRQIAGTLSGGEQQMVNIGRALMAQPRLLMLDEPSWGLAPLIMKEIGNVICEISKQRSIAILLAEQNAKLALACSQRAYIVENGLIALSGASDELRNNKRVAEIYVGGSVQ
jgi:branched-chain amino acid transport system ATP-binding protein